jgi:hypothetical protein
MPTNRKIFFTLFTLLFCIALAPKVIAQAPIFVVDKKDILIGEKIELTIIAKKAATIIIPDTIPHFEVIEKQTRDTILNNATISKTILSFTSFDSGSYYFPALQIKMNETISTADSFVINVGYMPIDKEAIPRDIKTIIEEDYTNWNLIMWIALGVLGLVFLFFVVRSLIKKKKTVSLVQNKYAYKDALLALQKLYSQSEENSITIKELHTELATVLKVYYSDVDNTNVLAKTSNEVLDKLQAYKLKAEIAVQTKTALQTGDATKFAKYEPQKEENKNAIDFIKNTIDAIENIHNPKNKI